MSKPIVFAIVAAVMLAGAVGVYRYYERTEVVRNHGDFQKRFQPTPPPPNGGRAN